MMATGSGRTGEHLRTALDGRWAAVRNDARANLSYEALRFVPDLDRARHRSRVRNQLRALVESGYSARGFLTEHGGAGDIGGSVTAFEMLAHVDLSLLVKAGVQWGLFGGAVENLGTESHHGLIPGIIDLSVIGCFAMTETGRGSDVQSLRTVAAYDPSGEHFVLTTPDRDAWKDYIGAAAVDARIAVVFAQLTTHGDRGTPEEHGVHAFLVPLRNEDGDLLPGIRAEDDGPKIGLNGVDNGRLAFDGVRVPRTNLLDRYGQVAPDGTYTSPIDHPGRRFFTMLGTLVRGRVSVAGAGGSAARLALAVALRYAARRTQFTSPDGAPVPLLTYRVHQRRLLPLVAQSYAFGFAQNELVQRLHEIAVGDNTSEHDQRELEARAAGLKALATWHATRTIQECREACGGAGYLLANRIGQLRADTDVFTTFEGDNHVLLQLVAKDLLTGYAAEYRGLDTLGTIRFVARQVAGVALERTTARGLLQRLIDATRSKSLEEADLLERGTQLRMFEDRETHVLETLARRLRRAGDDDTEAFAVFNDAQDHVVDLGRVHIERVVLEAFVAGIDACPDSEARAVLDRLCDLWVLSRVEADKAWFLEHGRLTPNRSKNVTAQLNQLGTELAGQWELLVAGFGIPDGWLDADLLNGSAQPDYAFCLQ